jgi:hypothetical protein
MIDRYTILVDLCEITYEFIKCVESLGYPDAITIEYDMFALYDICDSLAVKPDDLICYIQSVAADRIDPDAPVVNLNMSTSLIDALDTCVGSRDWDLLMPDHLTQKLHTGIQKISNKYGISEDDVSAYMLQKLESCEVGEIDIDELLSSTADAIDQAVEIYA